MNRADHSSRIQSLCRKYTPFNDKDIDKLIEVSKSLQHIIEYYECDVFIDVPSKHSNEAIVVYHGDPGGGKSVYQRSVVGEKALRENEPGVIRTLETGISSKGLKAKTQENRLVTQTVFPIKNDEKVIGVLILEKDVSEDIKQNFEIQKNNYKYEALTSTLSDMIRTNEFINNHLDDGILIFDKNGYLQLKNNKADIYYKSLGYMQDIQGLHYDNLSLDRTTFAKVMEQSNGEQPKQQDRVEVSVGKYFFSIKKIHMSEKDLCLAVVCRDITEIKNKEAEIISKSVAIREIHHRVKNNLQTVASLLRIQGRRCSSDEARKYLNESVSRILSIAATHELLSKQFNDEINIVEVIQSIVSNIKRCYIYEKSIDIEVIAEAEVSVDSDRTVAIALIINELLQNCFDHAFSDTDKGMVTIFIKEEDDDISIAVIDNGKGYKAEDNQQTSLGLSIVSSYVKEKLKGNILYESDGDGTKVVFDFEK
ncbi:histidine kinase N-terminal domain-containing protein [Brevibacillus ginsengisoli]|uniref:histidine kinase N-terminal domain-containing protein n=1 Tax=Brevibacillus ginsengisoli TaxID=363854 RepID=UPI003CE73A0F